MENKNRGLQSSNLVLYFQRLINKMFKLMPMKESNDVTYHIYLSKLISQLHGGQSVIINNSSFVEIIFNLESLSSIEDIKLHNSIIKESISLCQKLINDIELNDVELGGVSDEF